MGINSSCIKKKEVPDSIEQEQIRAQEDWDQLFYNNKNWVSAKIAKDPNFFAQLSVGQSPDILWIGCADSRVAPNTLLNVDAGKMFVHSNIANVVLPSDLNVQSVITYAVGVLKVKHIMVVGHYGCGGIKASLDNSDKKFLNHWIVAIDDVYRLHMNELDEYDDDDVKFKRLVELNAIESALTVLKNATVQKNQAKTQLPIVHACVYDLETGLLNRLSVDLNETMKRLSSIYDIQDQ